MLNIIKIFLLLVFLSSCSGKFEEKRAELDKVYGECDNPVRNLSKSKYLECLANQRANNDSFFDLQKLSMFGGGDTVVYQYSINPFLWNASLETTYMYPLKIADNNGGFIETDWIYDTNSNNERCLIKIRVLTQELVSNGIKTNFICETNTNGSWITSSESYQQEEKQLTLKILKLASELSETTL